MKKLLLASVAFALLAVPSFAATTGTVTVSGTVDGVCNMAFTTASVAIGTITVDPSTGKNTAQSVSNGVGTAGTTFCNTNSATMSITVVPLVGGTSYPGFTNIIPYKVTLPYSAGALNSGTAAIGTTYGPTTVGTFVQPVLATDAVKIDTEVAGSPVVAGNYSGTVTITLTP